MMVMIMVVMVVMVMMGDDGDDVDDDDGKRYGQNGGGEKKGSWNRFSSEIAAWNLISGCCPSSFPGPPALVLFLFPFLFPRTHRNYFPQTFDDIDIICLRLR